MSNPLTSLGEFPRTRMRRGRRAAWIRNLLAEHSLAASDLIWPLFVQEGKNKRTSVASLPGVARLTVDLVVKAAREAKAANIPAIALFPVTDPKKKTADGREACNPNNLLCEAVRAVKKAVPDIGIICDVALDPYTTHGHDGVLNKKGDVDNDATLAVLTKQALTLARSGCDIIAPSDMMDGRIGIIRDALDEAGFEHVSILAYAAKYASSFYGPFRDAVGSKQNLGKADKRTYQMNPANSDEALREVALDIAEGADMVMVKPGLPYLDVIHRVRSKFSVPVLAYQVSGEYSMIHAASDNVDADASMIESLLAFKRAGACAIFTYAALDVAKKLRAHG